jgi:hypothetical protein
MSSIRNANDLTQVTNLVTGIIAQARRGINWNQVDLHGLGTANIYTYRADIARTFETSGVNAQVALGVFEITMAQNNRARIVKGAKAWPALFESDVDKAILEFVINRTVQTTKEHQVNKICTLKIPNSFPEICATIFVINKSAEASSVIADSLITQLWSGSLYYNEALQALNKAAVKEAWDSWGASTGTTKNSKGEQIKFDESIYSSQAADKIRLVNFDGSQVNPGTNGYSKTELVAWVDQVKAAGVAIPAQRDLNTVAPAAAEDGDANTRRGGLRDMFGF